MLPFIYGFILALLLVGALFRLLYLKQKSQHAGHRREIEELSRLTGGLAHEIKNPLSTIKLNLRLISEDTDTSGLNTARNLRKIDVVQKETDRLEQILDDFLRYIGRTEPEPVDVDINELLGDMVDFYSPQAVSGAVTIRSGFCREALVCKIDPDMVKQVILNLFINAQQAMPTGGELIIRTEARKKNAIIEISDTGTGIASEKIDRIFEAYYTSKPSGSGLGLPTAAKIIEAHDGRITVNSQPDKGTSFTISLPLMTDKS